MLSLKTHVGSLELSNPLLLASGHLTETPDFFLAYPDDCAGMVTRSLKEFPPPERSKTPAPRYALFDDCHSMLNCEWGNSVPWTEWRDRGVAEVKKANRAIIVSLSGREIESCINLIREFDKIAVDAYEINISCSHSGALHGNLNIDFGHLKTILTRIRPITKTPIWIKLSYSPFLIDMAKLAEDLGANAIVCTNSIGPGMLIDIATATPKLGVKGGAGGVTGRAIFPIALNCVYQLAEAVRIPIVGSGGICGASDVVQMMMAGASAVQLYTAPALRKMEVFHEIAHDLKLFLPHYGYENIETCIGQAHGKRDEHHFEARHPTFSASKCVGCGKCWEVCDFGAIKLDWPNSITIDHAKCVGCSACESVCKTFAIKI